MTPAEVRPWAKQARRHAERLADEAEAMHCTARAILADTLVQRERIRAQAGRHRRANTRGPAG